MRPPRKQSERSVTKKGGGAGGGSGGVGGGGGGNGCEGMHVMVGSWWNGGVASKPNAERRSSGVSACRHAHAATSGALEPL
eukprot:3795565-Prymnesium_polylepis.1